MIQDDLPGPWAEEGRYFLQLLREVSRDQQTLLEERDRLRAWLRQLESESGQGGGQP